MARPNNPRKPVYIITQVDAPEEGHELRVGTLEDEYAPLADPAREEEATGEATTEQARADLGTTSTCRVPGSGAPFATIGFLGHPNAGKSSLINSITMRKVVSVSATPGHTKHLQTIFLNDGLRLCDCPGLVFPAVGLAREFQALGGMHNVSQLREPYSAVRFLAERVPIEQVYKLTLADGAEEWSSWSLCEAYAVKKGYFTTKGAPDTHRAALEILKDANAGNIVFHFSPPASTEAPAPFFLDPHATVDQQEGSNEDEAAAGQPADEDSENEVPAD